MVTTPNEENLSTSFSDDVQQKTEATEKSSYGQILTSAALIGGSLVLTVVFGTIRTKALAVLLSPSRIRVNGAVQFHCQPLQNASPHGRQQQRWSSDCRSGRFGGRTAYYPDGDGTSTPIYHPRTIGTRAASIGCRSAFTDDFRRR